MFNSVFMNTDPNSMAEQSGVGFGHCMWMVRLTGPSQSLRGVRTKDPVFSAFEWAIHVVIAQLCILRRTWYRIYVYMSTCIHPQDVLVLACFLALGRSGMAWYCVFMAADLVRTLLLRGGVEPNPGPVINIPSRDFEVCHSFTLA